MASAELKAVITAEDKASPTLNKFHTSVLDIAKGVALGQIAMNAMSSAANGLKNVVTGSIASFGESQRVTAQLDAALKSTGGAAGLARDELLKLSSELQKQTTFSDEAILSAENLLLTFTSIGKDIFPQATKTILDMSTALGQDTKSSAIQLGKALNDPIEGITALRRVGVSFNEQQREQIATLVESGQKMEAQKLILAELAKEFGGSAAAQAETFDGKMKQLGNQIDDVKERIGEAIIKGITPFVTKLTEFISSPAGQKLMDGVTASIERFFAFIAEHKDVIFAFFHGLAFAISAPFKVVQAFILAFQDLSRWITNVIFKIGEFANKARNTPIIGGLFGAIANAIGFAEGGDFMSGKPIVVGERGPELIIPKSSGTVIPNHELGGGIVINISGVTLGTELDIDTFAQRLGRQLELSRMGGI